MTTDTSWFKRIIATREVFTCKVLKSDENTVTILESGRIGSYRRKECKVTDLYTWHETEAEAWGATIKTEEKLLSDYMVKAAESGEWIHRAKYKLSNTFNAINVPLEGPRK